MKERMKINELLETTVHKKLKEYMRTDKPSRRRLYMEIYEFKDKTKIAKLPTTKENKTDEAKTMKIEYDCVTKDIIHVKLGKLLRTVISFMRLKDYNDKYGVSKEAIEAELHSGHFETYGTVVPTVVYEAPERYYLVVERSGKIYGWLGISWRTQLNANNSVKVFGGDVVSIGVAKEGTSDMFKEVHDMFRIVYENPLFTEMATLRFPSSYGDLYLVNHIGTWMRYGFNTNLGGFKWIPKELHRKMTVNGYDGLDAFYSMPLLKRFKNGEEIETWKLYFDENYKRRWKETHDVEMTAAESLAMTLERDMELSRIISINETDIRRWAERVHETLNNCGAELMRMSHCASILGLNGRHRDSGTDEGGDNDVPCWDGCDEFNTPYCRNECGGDPCHNCENDCGVCDYDQHG
jgi:hypothetical protein